MIAAQPQTHQISAARGNIYLPIEVYQTYFKGIDCVALTPHEEGALLIPLAAQSAGGLLLKIRNLRGDRVLHAQEFCREHGYLEPALETTLQFRWLPERAAMLLTGLPTVY